VAAHAMASVRAWWGEDQDPGGARGARAYESVQRAIRLAPDVPETHQARAMLAVQDGAFGEAAAALSRTLELAPTMAEAHEYLGGLQVEAGLLDEGRERLALALELDPSLVLCHLSLSRAAFLAGDEEAFARHQQALDDNNLGTTLPILVSRFRLASYRGDDAAMRRCQKALADLGTAPGAGMSQLFAPVVGEGSVADVRTLMSTVPTWLDNQRFIALMKQIAVEVFLVLNARDDALTTLEDVAGTMLIDITWLDRCNLFDPLSDEPRFQDARRIVAQRAHAMWRR
jgi:serine/threonine-protein kinase